MIKQISKFFEQMPSFTRNLSRLKKKLLIYFILIAVVSTSVTAEIIMELGSSIFQGAVQQNLQQELLKILPQEQALEIINEKLDYEKIFEPVGTLQIRALLLLLVISASIIGAFFQYTKDIVSPMEGMVEATKRIADGDLSVSVPVLSQDEIGQVGNLINDMSVNLQEMILQIKQEVMRLREKIAIANDKLMTISRQNQVDKIISRKRMKIKDLRNMMDAGDEVAKLMDEMIIDLAALQSFVNMYKVFQLATSSSFEEHDV